MARLSRSLLLLGSFFLSLLVLLTLFSSPTALRVSASGSITVDPPEPVEGDLISVRVDSYLPHNLSCYDLFSNHTVADHTISITIEATRIGEICLEVITDYSITEDVGVLAAGEYTVEVVEVIDGRCWLDCTSSTTFTVQLPDSDGDGWTDLAEAYIGTDPLGACSANAWPPDVNSSGDVSIDDIFYAASRFGQITSDPNYSPRAEIGSQDGTIGIDDIFGFASRFGLSCYQARPASALKLRN